MPFLSPARKIDPPAWMIAPETRAVLDALQDPGAAPMTLFVGGCVRNTFLDRAVDDVDLATVLPPETVLARLEAAGLRGVPTGLAHGTVTAVSGGKGFEITTLRRDLQTDGRHAVVGFTDDWVEDARRRDFTLNTLLAGPDGTIYDPLGVGLKDLFAHRIVFVGDPDQRIAEDRLRVLRFFRFHGAYGEGSPDESALAACARAGRDLGSLSRERVTQEFLKILAGRDPARVLDLMAGSGVCPELCGTSASRRALSALCALQAAHEVFFIDSRLVALTGPDPASLTVFENALVLPHAFRDRARAIGAAAAEAPSRPEAPLAPFLYRHGHEAGVQGVLLHTARQAGGSNPGPLIARLKAANRPVFPVSGADLIGLGLEPGPEMGRILGDLERWWLDQGCTPNRAGLLARVQK